MTIGNARMYVTALRDMTAKTGGGGGTFVF